MRRSRGQRWFARAILIAALIIGGWLLYQRTCAASTCSVRLTGVSTVVAVRGHGADAACDRQVNGISNLFHLHDEPRDRPAVCECAAKGVRATVRDAGVLKIVGNIACVEPRGWARQNGGS